MKVINSVKIDEEPIHIFDYIWHILDEDEGDYSLTLEFIITEVVALKYQYSEVVNVSLTYENGEVETFKMKVESVTEVGNAEIPIIWLYTKIDSPEQFEGLKIISWTDSAVEYPKFRQDITIEDIRKVEMPYRDAHIEAILPIDLEEWTFRNDDNISEILTEALYDYLKKKTPK